MKIRGNPAFAWPADLTDETQFRNEFAWHLARVKYAARNGRTDLAMTKLGLGTPSLRRKDSGDAGPVVIVEPPSN